MTIAERYSRAIATSNMVLEPFPCDVDKLIAAGLVRDGLATRLYRLRVEVETVDQKAVERSAYSLIDRVLVTSKLSSLGPALDALRDHAIKTAQRHHVMVPAAVDPHDVAAAVLDHWLLPTCPHCHGRQYEIIPGTVVKSDKLCGHCHGTGRRPLQVMRGGRWLADKVYADIERKLDFVGTQMMRMLVNRMTLD